MSSRDTTGGLADSMEPRWRGFWVRKVSRSMTAATPDPEGSGEIPFRRLGSGARGSTRRSPCRFLRVTVGIPLAIGVMAGVLGACSDTPERSAEAYCAVWKREATDLHDRYQSAADSADSNPIGALLSGITAPRDTERLFAKLERVAPDEIQADVEVVRESIKESTDAAIDGIDNPIGALIKGGLSILTRSSSFERVDKYTADNCGLPPYE